VTLAFHGGAVLKKVMFFCWPVQQKQNPIRFHVFLEKKTGRENIGVLSILRRKIEF
jgi:hypothetical protein